MRIAVAFFHTAVMSCTAASSRALRRTLLQSCAPRSRNGAVQQLSARRCYATDPKQEETESFKAQLYQSTGERLKRDKAEQARFATHREAEKARGGSPPWLVPLGMLTRDDAHGPYWKGD